MSNFKVISDLYDIEDMLNLIKSDQAIKVRNAIDYIQKLEAEKRAACLLVNLINGRQNLRLNDNK